MIRDRFKMFYKQDNLELAWRRIITSVSNLYYKNFYRELYSAYETNLDTNLKTLSLKIKNGYIPEIPIRFYKPKANGLERPFTFLDIDDQIVYQAMANVVIPDFIERRRCLENISIFSNIFCNDITNSIFLYQDWKKGYRRYKESIRKRFENGNRFTAHFDLASYYDTIDHNSLLSEISNKKTKLSDCLQQCLERWSNISEAKTKKIHHGLPQGPIASSVFAELFLLSIDEKLKKEGILYSRYVDDIVIQGKSIIEIQKAVSLLNILCIEKGLVPQALKLSISESLTADEAIGKMPSLDSEEKIKIYSNDEKLLEKFTEAIKNKDISFIRYSLKTVLTTDCLIDKILYEFTLHYELAEDFCVYLKRFTKQYRDKYISFFGDLLLQAKIPYDFVKQQIWLLFAQLNMESRLNDDYINYAIKILKNNKNNNLFSLKYGIYAFLATYDDNRFCAFFQNEHNHLFRLLLIKEFNDYIYNSQNFIEIINQYKKSKYESYSKILPSYLRNLYLFGLLEEKNYIAINWKPQNPNSIKFNPIERFIEEDYKIKIQIDWKKLFEEDYNQASEIMLCMHDFLKMDKSGWLSLVDSFNDLLLKKVIIYKQNKNKAISYPPITKKNKDKEEIKDIGVLIHDCKDKNVLSSLISYVKPIHKRRCKLPLTHPKDLKTGEYSSFLNGKEQFEYKSLFIKAIEEVENLMTENEINNGGDICQ